MNLPDYEGNSIVNLMSSISKSFGNDSRYPELEDLATKKLKDHKNIVLLVLDGLGYEYLRTRENGSFLKENLHTKMTTVFPSSTASAIPTFLTGEAPQQHAMTGWFMYLREIGTVSTTLKFTPRYGAQTFSEEDIDVKDIFDPEPLYDKIENSSVVTDKEIKKSPLSRAMERNASTLSYEDMDGFFDYLERMIRSGEGRRYVYGYWPEFDSIAHDDGIKSEEAHEHFLRLDKKLERFVERIKDTDTLLLITSDHGLIDTTRERSIDLEEHEEFEQCFRLPPCGDFRTVYCYVKPSKVDSFLNCWEDELEGYCRLYEASELIEEGYFGLYEQAPELGERIGDYVLIMKENYTLQHRYPNEEDPFMVGQHGGTTEEEMYTPLSVIEL